MFCPKCGARNLVEQNYCGGCGHHLAGHRAALEGAYDDKKGSGLVSTGLLDAAPRRAVPARRRRSALPSPNTRRLN
ncbi:MAG: zinc-ribbon domain-containing protein [Blastocatellia bacterium]